MRALRKTCVWAASLIVGAVVVSGCGGDDFANEPRPPVPLELTGVIQERGVSVSPSKGPDVGAGPFIITISNQTADAHTVTLEGTSVDERVGPVQPQDTATIQKTLKAGTYEVRAGSEEAVDKEIPPAELVVGPERDASNDELLLP